jgi:hypothetical protein
MRISIAESTAVFAEIPRASRNSNRSEGSDKNHGDKKSEKMKKGAQKSHRTPREPGIGQGIIRAEKCRNFRENDSPLLPKPKKTPNLAC